MVFSVFIGTIPARRYWDMNMLSKKKKKHFIPPKPLEF